MCSVWSRLRALTDQLSRPRTRLRTLWNLGGDDTQSRGHAVYSAHKTFVGTSTIMLNQQVQNGRHCTYVFSNMCMSHHKLSLCCWQSVMIKLTLLHVAQLKCLLTVIHLRIYGYTTYINSLLTTIWHLSTQVHQNCIPLLYISTFSQYQHTSQVLSKSSDEIDTKGCWDISWVLSTSSWWLLAAIDIRLVNLNYLRCTCAVNITTMEPLDHHRHFLYLSQMSPHCM